MSMYGWMYYVVPQPFFFNCQVPVGRAIFGDSWQSGQKITGAPPGLHGYSVRFPRSTAKRNFTYPSHHSSTQNTRVEQSRPMRAPSCVCSPNIDLEVVVGSVLLGTGQPVAVRADRVSPAGMASQYPAVFLAVAAVLATVGLAACWLPARKAAALDPVKAIRYE